MKIKVIKLENGLHLSLPERATSNSAGRDLHAAISSPVTIKPLSRLLIPTGIAVELNPGYEIQIRPRSGLSFKHGITVLNSPGTIDSDYRGELGVILVNLGENSFVIEPGMRIAQMLVTKYEIFDWEEQTSIEDTIRGKSGFGSSGL